MKIQYITLLIALSCIHVAGIAQQKQQTKSAAGLFGKIDVKSALFVLRAEGKSSDVLTYAQAELESIEANWIESISVVKGEDARAIYGKEGRHGILVLTFKELKILPQNVQSLLGTELH